LGSGNFVDGLKQEEMLRDKMKSTFTIAHLLAVVANALGLVPDTVRKPSKSRMPALARGIICHLAIFEFGYSGSEVGKHLYLGSSGVSLAAKRGEKFLNVNLEIMKQIMDAIEK
jgi:hypothetical protein